MEKLEFNQIAKVNDILVEIVKLHKWIIHIS